MWMRSRAASLEGGRERGDDNLPTGWGLLHPVPRGNTFESFVVAPQAVQLPSSERVTLMWQQSHCWLGTPALI